MNKYRVCLIKYETYYVDAANEDEAMTVACELNHDNPEVWIDNPIDEFEVEAIKT